MAMDFCSGKVKGSSSVLIVGAENSQRTKGRNSNPRVRHKQLTAIFRGANGFVNRAIPVSKASGPEQKV